MPTITAKLQVEFFFLITLPDQLVFVLVRFSEYAVATLLSVTNFTFYTCKIDGSRVVK